MTRLATVSVVAMAAAILLGATGGKAIVAMPACTYENVTDGTLDRYVGDMWGQRTLNSQNRIIDCLDVQWAHHADPATPVRNAQFEKYASPVMLAALQFDVDNFVIQLSRRPALLKVWLDTLEHGAFIWEGEAPCDYDRQRQYLIILLEARRSVLQDKSAYAPVLSGLSRVQCRIID